MVVNNLGYIFECRNDALGKTGVMGKYNVMYKDNKALLTLVGAVDSEGKHVIPSRINKSIGFEALNSFCETAEDVAKFVRSNKPYFYKVTDMSMVASGVLVFDKESGELISSDDFGFYVPVTVSTNVPQIKDNKGNLQPALICEKIGTTGGLNIFKVKDIIVQAYHDAFLKSIPKNILESKEAYLSSLISVKE